ncbi:MAG: protein jag [Oscillospiraceae bacterium]|nr:protein jag [Oscillospiraceae bacterium]
MVKIFEAKTVEEAKQAAVAEFGVSEERIVFNIIEEPKKGLFGMKGIAKLEASFEPSRAEIARDYILSITEKMGLEMTAEIEENEEGAVITLDGENAGTIIGKRGDTLDAIQYLASMVCNKGQKDYYRITVDSRGYREKRKNILIELANKIAKNVLKTGYSATLEPMNPYERRIIHSAVSEIEGVNSRSIGEEPYRKVIIASDNPKRSGNRRSDNGRNRNFNRDSKDKKRKENFEPKSLDLKTSFEKDYKRPKPEDNLNAGLYGKIEF